MSTASDALPPELVERFRAAIDRLNPSGERIGLAVSGGPDSMAMMLLAHAAIPGEFEVATVDHGLRPEARGECALVVAVCEARGVPCEVLTVEVGPGNVQARAREARYDALGRWASRRSFAAIATAHHADDQAETVLMRLNRGSGVSGLAGVREESWLEGWLPVSVVRPLLYFRHHELRQVVDQAGIETATDPGNSDDSFDRVRIRKALAEADWLDPIALARSAAHLADADEAINTSLLYHWTKYVRRDGEQIVMVPAGQHEILLRMVKRALTELGGQPRGMEVAKMMERLLEGEKASLAGVLAEPFATDDGPARWLFRPEPPRRTG